MPTWLSDLLETSSMFIPHGHCYLWIPSLLWLHVTSDTLIGTAYVGISLILYLFVRKIRLPFSPVFIAFGLFIGLCGLTHFVSVWTVWNPDYWADGLLKAATAAASVATAIGLAFVRPQVEEVVHTARLSEERRIQLETTNAELELLYNKVKELDELKSQFFANVSHELRTPLALILGPVERMRGDGNLTAEQQRQLDNISRNGKSLLKHVNDLLDVAKLEEGKVSLRYLRLDLVPWLQRIAKQFELAAEHQRIDFQLRMPERLIAEVDRDMLERVVINLLSNAFKYTPPGGQVSVQMEDGRDLTLSVKDTGRGIDPEQQLVIFDRFRQAEGGSTREHGGTGLGLAIAKDFIQLHGGQLTVDSVPGKGATFTLRVPLRAPANVTVYDTAPQTAEVEVALQSAVNELLPRDTAEPLNALSPDKPTVLVVEDTVEMAEFIATTLQQDYNVVTACDGHEGLAQASVLQPDLMITDIMMPRMSGDQLVAALRQQSEFDHLPILLLTAKADDDLRVKLLHNGAQDYLTKPFLPQELLARAGNLIAMKRAGDTLRSEVASVSNDIEVLANQLADKHRQLSLAWEMAEVARQHAERSNQVKSQFLALISHELRTPLSTIQMNTQMIQRYAAQDLPAMINSQVQRMARAAQQLSALVEGLLEYTRLESGRLSVQYEAVDLTVLAREVVEAARLQIASPNVTLALAAPVADVAPMTTDPRLLRVILENLVINALKFTREGSVTLRIGAENSQCVFEVQDTGMGIPEEDIPRIFLPFEQLEPVQRKSVPGVGLGLALTRELVQLLGGEISVTSIPDEGSTFRVTIPRSRQVSAVATGTNDQSA